MNQPTRRAVQYIAGMRALQRLHDHCIMHLDSQCKTQVACGPQCMVNRVQVLLLPVAGYDVVCQSNKTEDGELWGCIHHGTSRDLIDGKADKSKRQMSTSCKA